MVKYNQNYRLKTNDSALNNLFYIYFIIEFISDSRSAWARGGCEIEFKKEERKQYLNAHRKTKQKTAR